MLEKSKAPIYLALLAMMVVTLWSVAWVRAREARSYHESLAPLVVIDPKALKEVVEGKDPVTVASPTVDSADAMTASAHP